MEPLENPSTSSESHSKSSLNKSLPFQEKSSQPAAEIPPITSSINDQNIKETAIISSQNLQSSSENPPQMNIEQAIEEKKPTTATKSSVKKKLIRVASKQKEVSGEEYLQRLMEEREVIVKKSVEKQNIIREDQGREDQIEENKKSPMKIENLYEEYKSKGSSQKTEELPEKSQEKSSKKESIEEFHENKQEKNSKKESLEAMQENSEEKSSNKSPSIAKYLDFSRKQENSRRSLSLNTEKDKAPLELKGKTHSNEQKPEEEKTTEVKSFLEPEIPTEGVLIEENKKIVEEKNINEENLLDTSGFGLSKKKEQEISAKKEMEEKEDEYQRKALEMQGIEKPSLTKFIQEASNDLQEKNVADSGVLDEKNEEKDSNLLGLIQNEEENKSNYVIFSDSMMKLEPELTKTSDSQEKSQEKAVSSQKSSKKSSKKNEKVDIVLTAASEEQKIEEPVVRKTPLRLKAPSPSQKRKSSLKPPSYTREDYQEHLSKRKSPKKSVVKFAENLEISENKNRQAVIEIPLGKEEIIVTRSKVKEEAEAEEKKHVIKQKEVISVAANKVEKKKSHNNKKAKSNL